jgi:hypothetical protein
MWHALNRIAWALNRSVFTNSEKPLGRTDVRVDREEVEVRILTMSSGPTLSNEISSCNSGSHVTRGNSHQLHNATE